MAVLGYIMSVITLGVCAAAFSMLVYVLMPVAALFLRIALFVLVWTTALQRVQSRSLLELVLLALFMTDACAFLCCAAGGVEDCLGHGAGALRIVLSISFVAMCTLTW